MTRVNVLRCAPVAAFAMSSQFVITLRAGGTAREEEWLEKRQTMNARRTITTMGWTWFGLGVFTFVSAVGGFLAAFFQGPPDWTPVGFELHGFLRRHYREAAAVQACLAACMAFSGFMLARRRPWARVIIQLLSALAVAWIVVFGIYWFRALGALTSGSGTPAPMSAVIRIIMGIGGAAVMITLAVAFGACIWMLNRPAVKEELR